MFQFRRFPTTCYFIHKRLTEYCSAGFPHSDIHGSRAAFASPWLFVDRYVLLRLPMPRHSPCALISLTFFRIMCPSVLLISLNLIVVFLTLNSLFSRLNICYFLVVSISHYLYSVFKVHYISLLHLCGGPEWTRTTDLTLIRRAL